MQGLRYNPGGLLAQAAAGVGGQSRLNSQKAADLSFISGEADRRNRIAELAQQDDLEGQKLQMAGQIAAQRGQTSTTSQDGGSVSPFTTAVLNAKKLAVQNAQDLDPSEQAAFAADAMNPTQGAYEFNQRIQKTVQDKKNIKAKNDVLEAAKDSIDPSDHAQISAMLGDSQYGPTHVMQAIQQSAAKKQKNDMMQQDNQQKQQVWSQAQQTLDQPGIQMLAPLVGDPNTNAHTLAAMLQREFQRVQAEKAKKEQAGTVSPSQQLVEERNNRTTTLSMANQLKKENRAIDWGEPDPIKATGGDPILLRAWKEHAALMEQVKQSHAKSQQILSQTDGTLLHSPSTGRVFKATDDGELHEVSGADQY